MFLSEDTKQDEKRKEALTRSEYHGVITSYAGLALSLIAIILSVITMYQSHIMETREAVQILRAEDDGYYHFDGEKLFKNFQVTVANNSAIPVSVVEITIERDGETQTFYDFPGILPLNMESNHTEMITIPWNIQLSEEDVQIIQEYVTETESDAILSSRPIEMQTDAVDWSNAWDNGNYTQALQWMRGQITKRDILTLSITLCTAKNHQYVLTTKDMGIPTFNPPGESEGAWVANEIKIRKSFQFISQDELEQRAKMLATQNTE